MQPAHTRIAMLPRLDGRGSVRLDGLHIAPLKGPMQIIAKQKSTSIAINMLLAAALAAVALSVTTPALAKPRGEVIGKVVGVADGDTLTILDAANKQHKVRLAYIDAPEKAQAFGNRAKQKLSDVCYGKRATALVIDTDRYGRNVAEVTCAGVAANRMMVEAGMAWVYTKYAKGQGALVVAESTAKAAKLGLWSTPPQTPPWEFRREAKQRN